MSMTERRFFLAHSKGEENLEARLAAAHLAVQRFANGKPYTITLGRDFFEREFKRCASWEAWTTEIVHGVNYTTREPLFHGLLVPAARVGAGTAEMIEKALVIGKLVLAYRDDGMVATVVRVVCENQKDWQTGYKLTVAKQFA